MAIRGKQVIYKYDIGNKKGVMHPIDMPFGAHILDVQIQDRGVAGSVFCLWAVVEENSIDVRERRFWILGTGWDIPKGVVLEHISTVQIGGFVWHVFEEPRY